MKKNNDIIKAFVKAIQSNKFNKVSDILKTIDQEDLYTNAPSIFAAITASGNEKLITTLFAEDKIKALIRSNTVTKPSIIASALNRNSFATARKLIEDQEKPRFSPMPMLQLQK